MDPHLTSVGELDGIADQIEQDLAHPELIADHPVRKLWVDA